MSKIKNKKSKAPKNGIFLKEALDILFLKIGDSVIQLEKTKKLRNKNKADLDQAIDLLVRSIKDSLSLAKKIKDNMK